MDRITNTYVPLFLLLSAMTADAGGFTVSRGEVPVFNVSRGDLPVSTVPSPPKLAKPKVLYVKRPDNEGRCVPCELFELALKTWKNCPVEFVAATANKPVNYPFYCWQDGAGNWYEIEGWSGAAEFERAWRATQKPVRAAMSQADDLAAKGIDVRGLTAEELGWVQQALAARYSVNAINGYIARERRRQGR